ncbi:PHP domain-containing protein [Spiribacter sp. C176]|uniref:PHP domain-containing protein n=1 Tax=Spiribacter salilacus TaxID=2664894 RepID=A0A6N7QWM4_9GAMM|nr:PHP domain-containing protein [Spiribacter salilacus]MRH78727.1 PHP domain-containing protein [Spiribacter salilacus]
MGSHKPVDLHMHSTASDGRLSPEALVDRVVSAGVELMALTDHDTLEGVSAAQTYAAAQGIRCLSGIELSARWARGVVHIVGLNFDAQQPDLLAGVAQQLAARRQRAQRIGERLERAGCKGILARVVDAAGTNGAPGRAHFARDLVAQGWVSDFQSAFTRYLKRGRPGYCAVEWATIDNVVAWIHAAGGKAVFAHPLRYGLSGGALRAVIQRFVECGGDAIEVVSGGSQRNDVESAAALARRFKLAASVGSDFHDPAFRWSDVGRLAALPKDLDPVWLSL